MPTTTASTLKTYSPLQFPDRAGLTLWQFARAQRLRLIPGPDVAGDRWSAAVFDDAIARIDAIKEAVGTLPNVGATRAEEHLAARFNLVVHAGTAAELARRGHLPVVGEHKGYPLYCGLALQNLTDRRKVARASTAGQLHMRDAAARILGLRASDFTDRVVHVRFARWGRCRCRPVSLY